MLSNHKKLAGVDDMRLVLLMGVNGNVLQPLMNRGRNSFQEQLALKVAELWAVICPYSR